MQYRKLLLSISLILFAFSCTKIEYIEVPVEIPVHDSLIIKVEKDETGYYGASGRLNNIYKEFQGSEYFINFSNSEKLIIQIAEFEWIDNTIWAYRDVIDFHNLDININIGDTIPLNSGFGDYSSRITHFYLDGDVSAECYEISNNVNTASWMIFTEYHEEFGEITGTIHADYVISDICPPKWDPSQPDTIRIRDFWFRAKLRE